MQFARLWRAVGRLTVLAAAGTILSDATTLVAVWSPQQLLIGADSNVITSIPNVIGQGCKISQDGATFYAFSGLVEDKTVDYNAENLAHDAVQGPGDLSTHLRHFLELAHDPLAKALEAVRRDSPKQYEYLEQNHPALQAIFAGVESQTPVLGVAAFSLGPDGSLIYYTKIVARGDDGLGTRIIYAGQQHEIRDYLSRHHDWPSADGAALVRTLIQREIDASRGEVGGPIDIVSIGPGGARWIQKKPECK